MADTKLFLGLVTFIALFTIVSSIIIGSYNDWNANVTDSSIVSCPAGAYCPSQPAQPGTYSIVGNIDLTTFCPDNISAFKSESSSYTIPIIPYWACALGIGVFHSVNANAFDYDYYYVDGVNPVNNYYIMNYTINNTVKQPFTILLHGDAEKFVEYFVIEFKNDGIRIPGILPFSYDYQYPVSNLFANTEFQIQTKYNPRTNNVVLLVGNMYGFDITQEEPCFLICPSQDPSHSYGGVGAHEKYVTIKQIKSEGGIIVAQSQSEETPGLIDELWSIVPYHDEIDAFASTVWGLITFQYSFGEQVDLTGTVMVPWWIVTFAIWIPLIGIFAYIITVLRGN